MIIDPFKFTLLVCKKYSYRDIPVFKKPKRFHFSKYCKLSSFVNPVLIALSSRCPLVCGKGLKTRKWT